VSSAALAAILAAVYAAREVSVILVTASVDSATVATSTATLAAAAATSAVTAKLRIISMDSVVRIYACGLYY